MNLRETQLFAGAIGAELERAPALHGLAKPARGIEEAGRVRVYITPGHFSRFVSNPAEWAGLKAELVDRWPRGSR